MSSQPKQTAAARRAAAGKLCAYCGQLALDSHQRPEHPIPRAAGSLISVYTVCDPCNERSGREVDQPWLDHDFVRHERWRLNVDDPRHAGRPPGSILDGIHTDEDGHRVVVKDGVPRYVGSIKRTGDRIQIAAADQQRADDLLERVKRNLRADGKELVGYQTIHHPEVRPMLSKTVGVSTSIGVRMGAKLGLAFAAEAYPESWRASPEAAQLRDWLWSDKPVSAEGQALSWVPSRGDDHPFSDPPNHTVSFWKIDDDRISVVVLVFGTLGFTVPVAPTTASLPDRAWQSGPTHGGSVLTTCEALMLAARNRFIERSGIAPD